MLVEHLDADARFARNLRGARRKLARRQGVARLVREAARQVAALAEDPAAGDRGLERIRRRAGAHDRPGRRVGRRRIAGLISSRVELRER
jgi:hypothetical protein